MDCANSSTHKPIKINADSNKQETLHDMARSFIVQVKQLMLQYKDFVQIIDFKFSSKPFKKIPNQ